MSFYVAGNLPDLQCFHLSVMDHSLSALTKPRWPLSPQARLQNLILRFPPSAQLLAGYARGCGEFREWLVGMGRRSACERASHLFCELYLKLEAVGLACDLRCPLPPTKAEWGDALGLSTVHINRTLQELRRDGLITLMKAGS